MPMNSNKISEDKRLIKILGIFAIFAPIFNIYRLGSISAGDILLFFYSILVIFIIFCKKELKIKIDKIDRLYLIFISISLINSLLLRLGNYNDVENGFLTKWLKLIIFCVVILSVNNVRFELYNFGRWYVLLTLLNSVLVFLQRIFVFNEMIICPYLSFLPLHYNLSREELVLAHQRRVAYGTYRPTAIFAEPAHFAQYALLGLVLTSCISEDKKRTISRIIILAAIIFCGSANGIAIAIIILAIWYFKSVKDKITVSKLGIFCILLVIGVGMIYKLGLIDMVWKRISTVAILDRGTTGNQRFLQGIAVFIQMPIINQLFGVGFGNVQSFLIENSIKTAYITEIGNEYMNAFSTVLVSTGILGFIGFMFIWILLLIKSKTEIQKEIWLVLTLLFCTSNMFYSCVTIIYLLFIRTNFVKNYLDRY